MYELVSFLRVILLLCVLQWDFNWMLLAYSQIFNVKQLYTSGLHKEQGSSRAMLVTVSWFD